MKWNVNHQNTGAAVRKILTQFKNFPCITLN